MTFFTKVGIAVLVLIAIPVLLNPAGWMVALTLGAIWAVLWWGGRYALEVHKWSKEGEKGRAANVRARARDDQGDN